MPKGKTPSLIGSSLGRPIVVTARKLCSCSRCDASIIKGQKCYDVPRPSKPFSSTRRFCRECFVKVLEETRQDLANLEAL